MNNFGVSSIEIFNLLSIGAYSGEPIPHGCLGVTVHNMDLDVEYYEQIKIPGHIGYALIGRCKNKFAHNIFAWVKGTTEGFAGRTIRLKVEEPAFCFPKIKAKRVRTFKGDLWDSLHARNAAAEYLGYELIDIGIRTSSDRGCYCKYSVPKTFITELLSKCLVIQQPTQDFFKRHADNYFESLKE